MLHRTKRIEACNASYWEKQAALYDENQDFTELTSKQLSKLHFDSSDTMLDIGAGTGRLTIPIAKQVKHVTAVDPSQSMLKILDEKAQKENLTNIEQINKPWEKLRLNINIEPHDVVVTSLAFFMKNIAREINKMDRVAKRQVCLFMSASKWVDDDLRKIIRAGSHSGMPDHIYLFNILSGMGILANVDLISFESRQKYSSVEDAVSRFSKLYHVSQAKESLLKNYLSTALTVVDGQFWLCRKRMVAMLWWNKNQ
jgi:ubiquinone/menaquinone biosynthesis C-methylase UbiE